MADVDGRLTDQLLTLLADCLFALENIGAEEDLCEKIREVLRQERPEEGNVTKLWDETPW